LTNQEEPITIPRTNLPTHQISDDDGHLKWHAIHEKHELEWNIISQAASDNFVEYKYYKDTDRCVLLFRRENGEDTPAQGIRDPVNADASFFRVRSEMFVTT